MVQPAGRPPGARQPPTDVEEPTTGWSALERLRAGFLEPDADSRPMMRWWWFGPDVERAELERELQVMAASGIGGVEVSYVYPLTERSPALLSEEVLGHLRYAAERAHELGLRFDLTLGSGWSFGGSHVTAATAARKLHWERREIAPDALRVPVTRPWPGDELVAGYLGAGSVQEPPHELVELVEHDGALVVPAGSGPRQVMLCWSRLTGQVVKRAAAGADGLVHDHYRAAATLAHLAAVGEPLLTAVPAELVGSVFCDSLEVYGSGWTPDLPAEFERRRGYPLLPRLPLLLAEHPDAARLRTDYHRTLTELYEENFVAVCRDWAHEHGVRFRIQSYGTPPGGVSSFRHADFFEGEGWGWKEITQARWATSAAHLYRRPVVSAEAWTWVHSPSFRATPLDLQGEAHEHFLTGINQLIGHGWPYSPPEADGLGWFFYAAGALDDRNPWWPAMPGLMRQLQRLSWLLRQGEPVADVLVYVPSEDVYPRLGAEVGGSLDLWKETRDHLPRELTQQIRESGRDFDLFDDDATAVLDPTTVAVVVVARASGIPATTRDWLGAVQAAGGTVLAVESPALHGVQIALADLGAALAAVGPPSLVLAAAGDRGGAVGAGGPDLGADVGVVHRRVGELDVHLVANTGAHTRELTVRSSRPRGYREVWDPRSGTVLQAGDGREPAVLRLEAYQALVVVGGDQPAAAAPRVPGPRREVAARWLDQPWQASFGAEATSTDVKLPHCWEEQPGRATWSGSVRYQTTVDVPEAWLDGGGVELDLGAAHPHDVGGDERAGMRGRSYRAEIEPPVREVVRVEVDGRPAGVLWSPPYRLDLGPLLRPGPNVLTLVVSNTAAGALATDTAIADRVAASRAGYGWRFEMQELDRAMDGVRSGLLQVPVLRRFE